MNDRKKRIVELLFFAVIMLFTFAAVFHGQNPVQIFAAVCRMKLSAMAAAIVLALLFVSLEGTMIWYLLSGLNGKSGLLQCIQYSFIGFFYSGITPSATGGQPMQLYYMKKDGNRVSDSTVVLMMVALMYKLVLVVIGAGILLFWSIPLHGYLGNFYYLFLLGIGLNVLLVALIWGVMLCPKVIRHMAAEAEKLFVKLHLLKPDERRLAPLDGFIQGYQAAVEFLSANPGKVLLIFFLTIIQRCTLFVLTYAVYRGFGLSGEAPLTIILLQAAVYIAVDMLPVPGAQGITELMYRSVFSGIFTGGLLLPSMLVSRAFNFYLLLFVSMCVAIYRWKR